MTPDFSTNLSIMFGQSLSNNAIKMSNKHFFGIIMGKSRVSLGLGGLNLLSGYDFLWLKERFL